MQNFSGVSSFKTFSGVKFNKKIPLLLSSLESVPLAYCFVKKTSLKWRLETLNNQFFGHLIRYS
jgi:hypothetical protein